MKKYLFVLLLVLAIGLMTAVESDPSDTVGYFKKSILSGGWQAISLPFGYTSLTPDAVLGTQFEMGDQLIDMVNFDSWVYFGSWIPLGASTDMTYGHAYWVNRDVANPNLDYYLLGKVDPSAVTIHVNGMDAGQWSAFGLNECRDVDVASLPITGVADGDQIINIENFESMVYFGGWIPLGSMTAIEPTIGYFYNSYAPTSYTWTYTPPARGIVTPTTSKSKK